jgi:hypothetical protein
MERGSLQARHERLTQLAPKVGPVAFARDRVLSVATALEPLLPDGGLVRGSTVCCQGATALSVALAMVSTASAAGSWLACVGMPNLGLRAADEVGIALERLVLIGSDPSELTSGLDESSWASMMAALIDGFDLIVLRGPPDIRAGTVRRLQARSQARGTVVVIVGNPGAFVCDVTVSGLDAEWEGLGNGSGRLARRRLTLSATGRRSPRPRRVEVWLPGSSGGIEPVDVAPAQISGVQIPASQTPGTQTPGTQIPGTQVPVTQIEPDPDSAIVAYPLTG